MMFRAVSRKKHVRMVSCVPAKGRRREEGGGRSVRRSLGSLSDQLGLTVLPRIHLQKVPSSERELSLGLSHIPREDIGNHDGREEVGVGAEVGEGVEVGVEGELVGCGDAVSGRGVD